MHPTEFERRAKQFASEKPNEGKASVSLFQRRLRLGYMRAAAIMDELEHRGIVGPASAATVEAKAGTMATRKTRSGIIPAKSLHAECATEKAASGIARRRTARPEAAGK